jgi:hypothetical protein
MSIFRSLVRRVGRASQSLTRPTRILERAVAENDAVKAAVTKK